jgi:transcriptional regulator with GAF, ATPase, and Fis domain
MAEERHDGAQALAALQEAMHAQSERAETQRSQLQEALTEAGDEQKKACTSLRM